MGRKVHSSARFVVGTNVRDGRSRPSDVNLTAERRMEFGTVFECEAGEESGASRGVKGRGLISATGQRAPTSPHVPLSAWFESNRAYQLPEPLTSCPTRTWRLRCFWDRAAGDESPLKAARRQSGNDFRQIS